MHLVMGYTAALVQQLTVETSQVLAWWFRRARLQLNGNKTHFMFLASPHSEEGYAATVQGKWRGLSLAQGTGGAVEGEAAGCDLHFYNVTYVNHTTRELVWGPAATITQVKSILVLQNQVLRFICKRGLGTRTSELLSTVGMLSIRQLVAYRGSGRAKLKVQRRARTNR